MVAIVLLIWGTLYTGIKISTLMAAMEGTLYYHKPNPTAAEFIWSRHNEFVTGIISVIGAIGLILNKRFGWFLAIISSTFFGILMTIVILRDDGADHPLFSITASLVIVFITCSFLLLCGPLRIKYKPTQASWVLIFFSIIALIADFLIF